MVEREGGREVELHLPYNTQNRINTHTHLAINRSRSVFGAKHVPRSLGLIVQIMLLYNFGRDSINFAITAIL